MFDEINKAIAERFKEPRVVEIDFEDGTKSVYAIQMTDGSYYGQEWHDCCKGGHPIVRQRSYPTFKSVKAAEKKLKEIMKV